MASIPVIGPIVQWWVYRNERNELGSVEAQLQALLKRPVAPEAKPLTQRALQLLEQCKATPALKKESAALERAYISYLKQHGKKLPSTYRTQENRDLVSTFVKLGISQEFLRTHPEFLTTARRQFWQHYFPFVRMPIRMHGNDLLMPVETRENSHKFIWKSWKEFRNSKFDEFRITYKGFAAGHSDRSKNLVLIKMVDSAGKCALQFVTACPVGRSLPSSIDFKETGHSFTQIVLPKKGSNKADVYSVGFYPRKLDDLGLQFFKTVPGVYRNHDSNVSRIQAKQVIPIVKQYIFEDDDKDNPCLHSIVRNMEAVTKALRAQGKKFVPITFKQIDKAMLERNEPELDRILIELTEIRELIVKGNLKVKIQPMAREQKAREMILRFERGQGQHLYNVVGANCTTVSYREEAFAFSFLDAKLDKAKAVRVFDSQVDLRDHEIGILDRISDIFDRILLHFFVALPLTGPLLGTGSMHPDPRGLKGRAKSIFPSVLSEMAYATHQMLVSAIQERPMFPAGEILSRNAPIVKPPGLWARIRYLWNRHLLLGT